MTAGRKSHPPWRQIAGIRNVLRHDYQRVEARLIWNVVHGQLGALEAMVRAELAKEAGEG